MGRRPRIDPPPVPPERLDAVPTRAEPADESDVRDLARDELGLHVTLYLPLPERTGFDEVSGFRSDYERAAEQAGERMAQLGVDPDKAARAAARLREVPARLSELPRAAGALAVFLDRRRLRVFALTRRVAPAVHVGRSFALRPLLADRQEQQDLRAALGAAVDGISRGDALARPAAAARAAAEGRVTRLWVAADADLAHHVDPTSGDLVPPLGDEDALDELAALVLASGGEARVFRRAELPAPSEETGELTLVAELRGAGSR